MNVRGGQPAGVSTSNNIGSAVADPKPAEPEQASNGATASKSPADANQMKGEMGFLGSAQQAAVAERFHSTKMDPNKPVDLTDKEMRNDMIRNAPQINPIAGANGPDACGGAAMANALILSSNTPEKAKANGQAVRKMCDEITANDKKNDFKNKFKLSPAEDQALKHMEGGSMSANDAMHLQQIMYRVGQRAPIGGVANPSGTGLSTSQIASTMAQLKANGAFQGSNVMMHCMRGPSGFDHWTTTVDGTHANSQVGANNRSVVMGGPPTECNVNNQNWQNDVWLNPYGDKDEIHVRFRGTHKDKETGEIKENQPPVHREVYLDPGKYKSVDDMHNFETDLLTKSYQVGE
jgi:hypothetical protein